MHSGISKSMSDMFTKAGQNNGIILDNANLYLKDFNVFQHIKNRCSLICEGQIEGYEFGYNEPGGGIYLRKLISRHETIIGHTEITPDNIVINGSGIIGVLNSIFFQWNKADKKRVMIPTPVYSAIISCLTYHGLELGEITTQRKNMFIPSYKDFKNAYTENTIGVIISNPGNPVCRFLHAKDMIDIINFSIEKSIYIIIDAVFEEAHCQNIHNIDKYFCIAKNYEKLIKIKSASKDTPHLSDFRIGWSLSKNTALNNALRYFNCMLNYSNSHFGEYLIGADYEERINQHEFEGYDNFEKLHYKNTIINGMKILIEYLYEQPSIVDVLEPECGNIIYFRFSSKLKQILFVKNSMEMANWLLDNENILLSPAHFFYHNTDDLWLRITLSFNVGFMIKTLNKPIQRLNRLII